MRYLLALILCLASLPAKAAVTIDRDHVQVGQTVTLYASPTTDSYLTNEQVFDVTAFADRILPGGYANYQIFDWQENFFLTSSAGSALVCHTSLFIPCGSNTTHTFPTLTTSYLTPGTYAIDWQITSSIGEFGFLWLYGPDGQLGAVNDGTYGFPIGAQGFGPTESGSFTITVTAVPEPSTWLMLLLGFVGIGFASRRITARDTPVSLETPSGRHT